MTEHFKKNEQGFTLLEVLVSITLTALVLGNLFALQSQSKRLGYKAQVTLAKTIKQRAYLNASWINDRDSDAYMDDLSQSGLSIKHKKELTKPRDKTSPLKFYLESYELVNENNEIILNTVRMKQSIVNRK